MFRPRSHIAPLSRWAGSARAQRRLRRARSARDTVVPRGPNFGPPVYDAQKERTERLLREEEVDVCGRATFG